MAAVATKEQRPFSEQVASKLSRLIEGSGSMEAFGKHVADGNAGVKLFGKTVLFSDIQDCIVNNEITFVSNQLADQMLDSGPISRKLTNDFYRELCEVQTEKDSRAKVEFVRCKHFPQVSDIKDCRFTVDASEVFVEPNSFVCINTGYLFSFVEGSVGSNICKDVILVPQIKSTHKEFVPSICPRDEADNGLFCITGFTSSGKVGTLSVKLSVYKSKQTVSLSDVELPNGGMIWKPKDSKGERKIKNAKVRVLFDDPDEALKPKLLPSEEVDDAEEGDEPGAKEGVVAFRLMDPTTNQVLGEKDVLLAKCPLEQLCVLFVSRKREWFNTKMFTVSGMLRGSKFLPPRVFGENEEKKNTHCFAFITGKIDKVVFSRQDKISKYRLFNGFFKNLTNYPYLEKCTRQIIFRVNKLFLGMLTCDTMQIDPAVCMRVYDYLGVLDVNQLERNKEKPDKDLYAGKGEGCPFSSFVYRGLVCLAADYYNPERGSTLFTPAEYAQIREEAEKIKPNVGPKRDLQKMLDESAPPAATVGTSCAQAYLTSEPSVEPPAKKQKCAA